MGFGRPIVFRSLTPDDFASAMSLLVTGSAEVKPLSIYDGMAQFYRWYNAQGQSPLVVTPEEMARHFKAQAREPCDVGGAAGLERSARSGACHAVCGDGAVMPFGAHSIR